MIFRIIYDWFLKLWNTNPLFILGTILFAQILAIQVGWLPISLLLTMILVFELGYLQNAAYALSSRSASRNNNFYHLLAAVGASLTFFWSLQLLVLNQLTPILLAPYVFATVLGTLHGTGISIKIETALGLNPEGAKGKPQLLKLWPTVAVLVAALGIQIWYFPPDNFQWALPFTESLESSAQITLIVIAFVAILEGFCFSLLRIARSSDSYWFHTVAVIFQQIVAFGKLAMLVNLSVDWALFIPITTGGVIGSLVGATLGHGVANRIGAKFDIHVYKKEELAELETKGDIPWPTKQLWVLSVMLFPQFLAFWIFGWPVYLLLFVLSAWQSMSFTMKSRAGQRNNMQYLGWVSVFSNGVWYLTLNQLSKNNITLDKMLPFIVGNAIGSLIGQLVSMRVERATGAVMNHTKAPAK